MKDSDSLFERRRIPIAIAARTILLGVAAWWIVQGQRKAASTALIAVVIVLLMLGLARLTRGRWTSASATAVVSVPNDADTALRVAESSLAKLTPAQSVDIDYTARTASIAIPRSWKSFGERVVATVGEHTGGSTIEISSRSIRGQVFDYGKNRENVALIVHTIQAETRG
jgi:hypothetical protein